MCEEIKRFFTTETLTNCTISNKFMDGWVDSKAYILSRNVCYLVCECARES